MSEVINPNHRVLTAVDRVARDRELGLRERDRGIVSPPKVVPIAPQAPVVGPGMVIMDEGANPVGFIPAADLNASEKQATSRGGTGLVASARRLLHLKS